MDSTWKKEAWMTAKRLDEGGVGGNGEVRWMMIVGVIGGYGVQDARDNKLKLQKDRKKYNKVAFVLTFQ